MFNEGSNEMSRHMDNVFNHGISKGMTEKEAALHSVTKFLEFLADPNNLEKAFRENPEIAALGTVNIIRWANEWLAVKHATWSLPDTVEELIP